MPLDVKESQFTDINLSDVPKHDTASPASGSGPWTHSTNSYSRKMHPANSNSGQKVSRKHLGAYIGAGIVIFVVGLALGIVIGHFGVPKAKESCSCPPPTTTSFQHASPTFPQCRTCSSRNPDISTGEERKTSPFAPLSVEEMKLVSNVLLAQNLTSLFTSLYDDRTSEIYLFPPDKSSVLDYLDNNGTFPGRYAKAHVIRGSRDPPDIMEYKVGPLNETVEDIAVEALRANNEISFNQRPYDPEEYKKMYALIRPHLTALNGLLEDSFDGAYHPRSTLPNFAALPSTDPNDRLSHMYMYLYESGTVTLRIIPVTCRIHHPGSNASKWTVSDFYYLNQGPFDSGAELQEAYDSGRLRKLKFPAGYWDKHFGEYNLVLNKSEPARPLADIPPPRTYEPEGPRYNVKGHRVSWMGWEFEFSTNPIRGPAVFDVRFMGERIAYEISLQDITLIYSSASNGAGPPAISDTVFQLGNFNVPRFGVDCPDRATVFTSSLFTYEKYKTIKAACVFETNGQEALWRHTNNGLEDNYLVVRAAMNLGNYDYTAEWRFHLDGSLDTKISASGYLYGAFWDPDDPLVNGSKSFTPFGYRISDFLLGPIHDHTYSFKVDLDILGTENSFETVHWRSGSTLEGFQSQANISEKPGFFYFNHTRFVEHELLEHEQSYVSDPFKPKYFTVVNENEQNVWGVKRGYRIIPHASVAENLPDHLMFNQWEHLKRQISVTRRKDSEQTATESWYGLQQPTIKGKGLLEMLNNETIRNTDLVLWISEKFFHAPTTEDLPMTVRVQNGFTLKPHNYFDRTPVFDIPAHYSRYSDPYVTEPCYESSLNS